MISAVCVAQARMPASFRWTLSSRRYSSSFDVVSPFLAGQAYGSRVKRQKACSRRLHSTVTVPSGSSRVSAPPSILVIILYHIVAVLSMRKQFFCKNAVAQL